MLVGTVLALALFTQVTVQVVSVIDGDTIRLEDGRDLAEILIETGHGRPYDGGPRETWCPEAGRVSRELPWRNDAVQQRNELTNV